MKTQSQHNYFTFFLPGTEISRNCPDVRRTKVQIDEKTSEINVKNTQKKQVFS